MCTPVRARRTYPTNAPIGYPTTRVRPDLFAHTALLRIPDDTPTSAPTSLIQLFTITTLSSHTRTTFSAPVETSSFASRGFCAQTRTDFSTDFGGRRGLDEVAFFAEASLLGPRGSLATGLRRVIALQVSHAQLSPRPLCSHRRAVRPSIIHQLYIASPDEWIPVSFRFPRGRPSTKLEILRHIIVVTKMYRISF